MSYAKKNPGKLPPPAAPLASNPFGALAALRDALPVAAPTVVAPPTPPPPPKEKPGPARAVVRMERKGRGGKEATIVEQLGLPAVQLEAWCKALKNSLGCGGTVDGDDIVLQGDLRKRLEPILLARGVRKVTISG